MKAKEWYDRGKQAEDPINALTDFWRGFNGQFFKAGAGQERDQIKRILREKISEAKAKELLEGHAKGRDYLLSQPVIDMRGNGKDTALNIDSFNAAPDSLTKLQELFMVIYQVRCNLEHGQKSPSRDRDVRLCQAASPIVADIVELCT